MTKARIGDRNLQNVVKDLKRPSLGGHANQQRQQKTNDRRHQDLLNHEE